MKWPPFGDVIVGMSKETFLRELLGRMSVEDKAAQLNLLTGAMDATGMKHSDDLGEKIRAGHCGAVLNVYTPAATRALQVLAMESPLRIPLIFGYDVIHGHRTIFPIPLGLSCSWNPGSDGTLRANGRGGGGGGRAALGLLADGGHFPRPALGPGGGGRGRGSVVGIENRGGDGARLSGRRSGGSGGGAGVRETLRALRRAAGRAGL